MFIVAFVMGVAGLVLSYADKVQWFNGAHNTGAILLWAALAIMVYLIIVRLIALHAIYKVSSTIRRNRRQAATRRRRGF